MPQIAQPPPPPPRTSGPALDARERPLAPAALTAWRLSTLASLGPPGVVVAVLGFVFLDPGWLAAAAAAAALVATVLWLPPARYRRWRWRLGEIALELRSGVLIHRQDAVPYFRIQQIDVVRGPIERLLGLSTLQVTTASASGSAVLPGLAADDAPDVRTDLLRRAALAVADHPGDLRDAV